MKLNPFLWKNYRESKQGTEIINLFGEGLIDDILKLNINSNENNLEGSVGLVEELLDFTCSPVLPEELNLHEAEKLFDKIIKDGIILKPDVGTEEILVDKEQFDYLLDYLPELSVWLYLNYPDYFKPYFFKNNFQNLTKIADTFGIRLPEVPLKRYKKERVKYYWELCKTFTGFQLENSLSAEEFCAFLYDFAPNYIQPTKDITTELPQPTQVWMVGGDKGGNDFEFLDNAKPSDTNFWQGNVDTKRGDIIIMYCLAPRSYIHSIWRAVSDGIADPFFYYYSNIYIGYGQKVIPIHLNELKDDSYFSQHPLVRKNLQGVSGYAFTMNDYENLLLLLKSKGEEIDNLPKLYSPNFNLNNNLLNEREVELTLLEPLFEKLGFGSKDWIRQLPIRMGRGERNYPDYVFLAPNEKGYDKAYMLVEAKYFIKTNKELEDTFLQAFSYAMRLDAIKFVICDKNSLWIYERLNGSFDRSRYLKKYWQEIENSDEFRKLKKLLTPK